MKEVCHDVRVEPELLPIASDRPEEGENLANKASLVKKIRIR